MNQSASTSLYSNKEVWEQAVRNPKLLQNPAFSFVEPDTSLPDVLLIGDSISMGYTPRVRELLKGKANLYRIPENGGDTARGLEKLSLWLGHIRWQVIHFNWGLHDLKYMKDDTPDLSGELVRTPEAYEQNIRTLVESMLTTGAKLIWANTTPVPANSRGRVHDSDQVYNERAMKVMVEKGIEINDLNACVRNPAFRGTLPEDVHYDQEGYGLLGDQVADVLLKAL